MCSSVCCLSEEPTYEAIWADNKDFNEVVISPTMVNDHMPDNVLDALEKVRLSYSTIGSRGAPVCPLV